MDDTRTKILDVAEDLVRRVGLNAMSYKHISEAVGIRKASVHHHLRIPLIAATHSKRSRPPIPFDPGHPFHVIPAR